MKQITLPDGLTVWAYNAFEAKVLYREIVEERTYERHGIQLPEGSTVFDIGANIGLFAIHLRRTIPNVKVHCFELVPDIFTALQPNLEQHAPEAQPHNVGLGDRDRSVEVAFDRYSSMTSSMHPEIFLPPGASSPLPALVHAREDWATHELLSISTIYAVRP